MLDLFMNLVYIFEGSRWILDQKRALSRKFTSFSLKRKTLCLKLFHSRENSRMLTFFLK
jgi:hypothetical protein